MEDVNKLRRNFLFVLNLEGMNSVRGEKIDWKNAESSTKQLQQENAKKCHTTTNNNKNLWTESSAMM